MNRKMPKIGKILLEIIFHLRGRLLYKTVAFESYLDIISKTVFEPVGFYCASLLDQFSRDFSIFRVFTAAARRCLVTPRLFLFLVVVVVLVTVWSGSFPDCVGMCVDLSRERVLRRLKCYDADFTS